MFPTLFILHAGSLPHVHPHEAPVLLGLVLLLLAAGAALWTRKASR